MRRIMLIDHRASLAELLAKAVRDMPGIPAEPVKLDYPLGPIPTEPTAYKPKNRAPKPKQSRRK